MSKLRCGDGKYRTSAKRIATVIPKVFDAETKFQFNLMISVKGTSMTRLYGCTHLTHSAIDHLEMCHEIRRIVGQLDIMGPKLLKASWHSNSRHPSPLVDRLRYSVTEKLSNS